MKVIVVGDFSYEIYARAFESGFKDLGIDVICHKYDDYCYSNNFIGRFLTRFQNRYHIGYHLISYNEDLIRITNKYKPDLIFLYRCYHIWSSTIMKIRSIGSLVFTYNNDDPFCCIPSKSYFRNFFSNIKLADHNFVYREKNLKDYINLGLKSNSILMPYYLKNENYFLDIKKDIDIAFIGHFENDGRDVLIKSLLDNDLPITVFNGSYWEKSPLFTKISKCIKESVHGKDYNVLLNRCKIALVFLSKHNHDVYTRRCFEIPATKTLMLSEYTEELNTLFPDNECAVYFKNPSEFLEKCIYLLNNPTEISRIANNGYNRLLEIGGTEVDRCREVIDVYKSIVDTINLK